MPCSFRDCNGTTGLKSLPNVNSDSKRRKSWMRYCKHRTAQLKYPRVCMLHFSDAQMVLVDGKSYLKPDAIPDVNLPSSPEGSDRSPPHVPRPPLVPAPMKREVVSPTIKFEQEAPSTDGGVETKPSHRETCSNPDQRSKLWVTPERRSRLKILVKPDKPCHKPSSVQREIHVNVVSVNSEEDMLNTLISIEEEEEDPAPLAICNESEVVIYHENRKLHKPNTKGGVFYCQHCNYACVGPRILSKHVKRKHGHIGRDGRHKCDQCDYSTDHKGTLNGHMLKHSGARPHRCDQCDMTFRQRGHLNKHLRVHTGHALLVCDICGAEVVSQYSLARHRRLHFPYPRRVCEVCGEAFPDDSNYSQHMRRKHMEREHLCEVCSARFVGRAQLEDHMQTHTGERPFNCEFCVLTFKQKTSLYQHKRRCHTHDFRIWCDYCEKGFLANRDMQRHVGMCARKYNKAGACET